MMKKVIAAIAICGLAASFANAQMEGSFNSSNLVMTNTGSDAIDSWLGIDITSPGGGLDGTDPAPFSITLLNTPNQVVVGNLGNPVSLDAGASVTTGITWDGSGELGALTATWGDGATPTAFPIVPEPASGLMACLAALCMLGLRRRR